MSVATVWQLLALVLVSAFALASPADAKTRKRQEDHRDFADRSYGPQYRGIEPWLRPGPFISAGRLSRR